VSPDVILYNGKIVTVDPKFSIAQAVAVSGERMLAVGADEAIVTTRAAKTKMIDLHGRTVLPGLIDSHVHALEAGLSEFQRLYPRSILTPRSRAFCAKRRRPFRKANGLSCLVRSPRDSRNCGCQRKRCST
jgi:predicted amidohydrolase YtcJ